MKEPQSLLARNDAIVRLAIARACERCGRSPAEVTLVAVTKYAPVELIADLVRLGHRDFGESRPQQLIARAERPLPDEVRWHLIGHLQRNKAAAVLPYAALIHSCDSERIVRRLSSLASESGRTCRILLEVNVSGEAAKDGFTSEELRRMFPELVTLPGIEIAGFMTMAPLEADAEAARPVFRALRELRDELRTPTRPLAILSMGMSHDFEVAIEEGATMVRVGSRLFAGVPTSDPRTNDIQGSPDDSP